MGIKTITAEPMAINVFSNCRAYFFFYYKEHGRKKDGDKQNSEKNYWWKEDSINKICEFLRM